MTKLTLNDGKDFESATVKTLSYVSSTGTLEVTFKNKNSYQYKQVPQTVFDDLVNAASKGSYINSNVKGTYAYENVTEVA